MFLKSLIMDKLELNKQIVLCRPAVTRAKVIVIRKKIKKLEILKKCKKENLKEKKSKKVERIIEEIQVMKKVREDDVTKFALLHSDLDSILAKTLSNDPDHVYAALAKHSDVQKRINKMRESIPDWEHSLLPLLQSLGTRTLLKKSKIKNSAGQPPRIPNIIPVSSQNKTTSEKSQDTMIKVKRKSTFKKRNESESESNSEEQEVSPVKPELKVQDSFFVNKVVTQPKLLSVPIEESWKDNKEKKDHWENGKSFDQNKVFVSKTKLHRNDIDEKGPGYGFKDRPQNNRYEKTNQSRPRKELPFAPAEEEKLHPSWAAKKVKLIQPFQGTKIKFDD